MTTDITTLELEASLHHEWEHNLGGAQLLLPNFKAPATARFDVRNRSSGETSTASRRGWYAAVMMRPVLERLMVIVTGSAALAPGGCADRTVPEGSASDGESSPGTTDANGSTRLLRE